MFLSVLAAYDDPGQVRFSLFFRQIDGQPEHSEVALENLLLLQ